MTGITEPPLNQAEIAVIVTDPRGNDKVYFTTTNENGAFQTTFPANEPGTWTVYSYYAGDDCNAPTESERQVLEVPVPGGGIPWWCCFIVIMLLLIIVVLIIRYRRQ